MSSQESTGHDETNASANGTQPAATPGNIDYARSYVKAGFVVIPLWPGKKIPHASEDYPERALLGSGFKLKTVGAETETTVEEWWGREPHAGVGIVCGERSRFVGIDVDVKNLGEWAWEAWKAEREDEGLFIPDCPLSSTPSGGYHLWFRLPQGVDIKKWDGWLPGVDVLGTGHYFAVPPTYIEEHNRSYEFLTTGTMPELPEWMREAMTKPRRRRTSSSSTGGSNEDSGGQNESLDGDAEGEFIGDEEPFDWVTALTPGGIPPGEQQPTLYQAACSLRSKKFLDDQALEQLYEVIQCFTLRDTNKPWTTEHVDEMWERVKEEYPEGVQRAPLPDYQPPQLTVIQGGLSEAVDQPGPVIQQPVIGVPAGDTERDLVDPVTSNGDGSGGGSGGADAGDGGGPLEGPTRNTDRANAELFWRMFRDKVVYVPEYKSDEDGWSIYDGVRWKLSAQYDVHRLVLTMINRMLLQASALEDDDAEELRNRAYRLEGTTGRTSMLKYAKQFFDRSVTKFDQDPWLLNTPSGTLDLNIRRNPNLELRPHDPKDYLSRCTTVSYVPEASDSVWENFIQDALPDAERDTFQRFMGSCLTGIVRDKAFLVPTGPRNTGKSTATEPILQVLGDISEGGYASVWSESEIQRDRRASRPLEMLDQSRAARLVMVGELVKGSKFNDSYIKGLTGGDSMPARALYGKVYNTRPGFKMVMHTNYVPTSTDPALHSRLKLLPFQNVFETGCKDYLEETPGVQEAILAWVIQGCLRWQQDGLGEMPWLDKMLHRYVLSSDALEAWLHECVEYTDKPEEFAATKNVWDCYESWSLQGGEHRMPQTKLRSALEERGWVRGRGPFDSDGKRPSVWLNMKLLIKNDTPSLHQQSI